MKFITRILRHLSLKRLVLLGVGFTLLPMLAGLVSALFAVGQLSSQSQHAIHHVAAESKSGQALLDRLNDLERRGIHYLSLRDTGAFTEFKLIHEQFGEDLQGLVESSKSADSPLAVGLEALAKEEKITFDAMVLRFPVRQNPPLATKNSHPPLDRTPSLRDPSPESDLFQSVKATARDLSYGYAAHIEEESKKLASLSQTAAQSLVLHIVLLLSTSFIVLVVFVYLLHNPIRQIDFFIRTLGAGNFTQPIRVVGTADVEFLGERLEWLRTHLNDLEMAKQRFVRNVSHEIKTPLATIHEGADLLSDEVVGVLNREQKDIARIIVGNADKMDKMIAELINYSQVSARMTYQKLSLVDMRQLTLDLLEDYRLQLRGRSVSVVESVEPMEIMGDKEQLRTIFDNLLSNAVKYSPEGGEIRLSLTSEGGHMVLEIEDDGPGIDPDDRVKVFEPFFQGRSSRALGVKGTGFGLAIVAECVASHHGKVEVLASHEDRAGARIRVQIPMQSSNYRKSNENIQG